MEIIWEGLELCATGRPLSFCIMMITNYRDKRCRSWLSARPGSGGTGTKCVVAGDNADEYLHTDNWTKSLETSSLASGALFTSTGCSMTGGTWCTTCLQST